MPAIPTIAIVGRPNVGKSSLFNYLAGRRISIVHDMPGVTRDRIAAPCQLTTPHTEIIDTGGIGATMEDELIGAVTTEANIAVQTSDLILFVVDAQEGLTAIDAALANQLQKSSASVLLVLNKADNDAQVNNGDEFASLGMGNGVAVSAAHRINLGGLLDEIDAALEPIAKKAEETQEAIAVVEETTGLRIAIVGKPNAGKSSLINAILDDERTIVSPIAGTTRDAVDVPYSRGKEKHLLIDTAGLRPRSKMDSSVEVFSSMRSERSIRRSDICLLVVDLDAGATVMDRKIARLIQNEQKPCLIVANKFDLFHPNLSKAERLEKASEHIRTELFFLHYAPFVCVSSLKRQSLDLIFKQITKIREGANDPPTTGQLNRLLSHALIRNPPAEHKKLRKRMKLLYATTKVDETHRLIPSPVYLLFLNDKRLLGASYTQYLENRIRDKYPSYGLPITFSTRSRRDLKAD